MNVTVVSTGGTIVSTADADGATPVKTGTDLIDAVPQLADVADITVEDVAQVPSYEMDTATLETIGDRVRDLDAEPSVDAVVLTHGTDTMAETAYYLDVTGQPETPVVLTGAQRRPDEISPDGPANLLTAVRAATAFRERGAGGTFVAFDERVHAARYATKRHTSALDAFCSVNAGRVATVDRDDVVVHRRPMSETRSLPATSVEPTVFTIKSGSCITGDLIDAALDRGVDGFVIEGTGLGNTTAGVGDGIRTAIAADIPVVLTSRCLHGRTMPVYGGDGGGATLHEDGAIFASDLPAGKARLRLMLALAACDGEDWETEIRDAFAD